ncbi:MAG: hypothetical protein HDS69_03790 [Bacteroidales bacterium]|nr:hypothetical protein [Bacteroidales bacterium]
MTDFLIDLLRNHGMTIFFIGFALILFFGWIIGKQVCEYLYGPSKKENDRDGISENKNDREYHIHIDLYIKKENEPAIENEPSIEYKLLKELENKNDTYTL